VLTVLDDDFRVNIEAKDGLECCDAGKMLAEQVEDGCEEDVWWVKWWW